MEMNFFITVFFITLLSYVISFTIGFILAKMQLLNMKLSAKENILFKVPFTHWLQARIHKNRIKYINEKRWFKIFIIIFINNFFVVAFIARTIWGIIFLIQLLWLVREGIRHAIIYQKTKPNIVFYFEYGALLLASSFGITIGLSLMLSIIKSDFNIFALSIENAIYVYPIIFVLIFIGALIETVMLKRFNITIPENVDFAMLKEKALEMFNK